MKHWLFENIDEESDWEGEEFIVGADSYHEAREIIVDSFGDIRVKFWHELTEEEAEMSGLDEY